jgi:hypothetical protein
MSPDQLVYVATNIGLGGAVLYVFYKYLDKLDALTQAINELRATQEKLILLIDYYLKGGGK